MKETTQSFSYTTKEIPKKDNERNHSFVQHRKYEDLPRKLRCQSTYSSCFGFRSTKYQLYQDIQAEFNEHKKARLANVIINNLKKQNPIKSNTKQNSSRNILGKPNITQNRNYSSFMKKVKDFKNSENQLNSDQQIQSKLVNEFENQSITKQPSLEKMLNDNIKQFSQQRKQSPNCKILLKPQLAMKSLLQKGTDPLSKMLQEARVQMKSAQSPRSFVIHHSKTARSQHCSPINAYAEQNKFLQKQILLQRLNCNF